MRAPWQDKCSFKLQTPRHNASITHHTDEDVAGASLVLNSKVFIAPPDLRASRREAKLHSPLINDSRAGSLLGRQGRALETEYAQVVLSFWHEKAAHRIRINFNRPTSISCQADGMTFPVNHNISRRLHGESWTAYVGSSWAARGHCIIPGNRSELLCR